MQSYCFHSCNSYIQIYFYHLPSTPIHKTFSITSEEKAMGHQIMVILEAKLLDLTSPPSAQETCWARHQQCCCKEAVFQLAEKFQLCFLLALERWSSLSYQDGWEVGSSHLVFVITRVDIKQHLLLGTPELEVLARWRTACLWQCSLCCTTWQVSWTLNEEGRPITEPLRSPYLIVYDNFVCGYVRSINCIVYWEGDEWTQTADHLSCLSSNCRDARHIWVKTIYQLDMPWSMHGNLLMEIFWVNLDFNVWFSMCVMFKKVLPLKTLVRVTFRTSYLSDWFYAFYDRNLYVCYHKKLVKWYIYSANTDVWRISETQCYQY